MLLEASFSRGQSQKRLMTCVLWRCSMGSTSAAKTYCRTLSKMTSHSSTSTTSNCSGRHANKTSVCSSSKRSSAEASSCRVRVFAMSRCGQKLLMHFSSYMRLELPMTYVWRPAVPLLPLAPPSGRRSNRWRSAGGWSRSTVTNMGWRFVYSGKRCTSAESPTCSTFLELLPANRRLMMANRLSTASSVVKAPSSRSPTPLLFTLRSSETSPKSSRLVKESLPSSWAERISSWAWTSHHSSVAKVAMLGISATML
mmetsp:Transcript_63035/g.174720  ORF Transcript_63035/g.174720 Transcript_63035/m.174720 type:complete len:255 (+) Transcript_63035:308-1072(+)